MNIPGLFIEYLIVGGISCLWLLPFLLWLAILTPSEIEASKVIIPFIGIPFLYIMSLLIDLLSSALISSRKDSLREKIQCQFYEKVKGSRVIANKIRFATVEIMHLSGDLGKEFAMRSSRDRIARETFLNLIIAAFVLPFLSKSPLCSLHAALIFFTLLGLSGVFYLVWEECEKDSFWYKLRAIYILLNSTKSSN